MDKSTGVDKMKKLLWIVAGYLNGSLLFAKYITKVLNKKDIVKDSEDKNPGTANAFMMGGAACGILVLCCELFKGFFPVYLFRQSFPDSALLSVIMIAPVLGHAFSIFHDFQGGQAIAVSFGVLLGLFPDMEAVWTLVVYYLLFSALRVSPHSKRSILTFLCFAATTAVRISNIYIVRGCIGISAIVIFKHIKMRNLPEESEANCLQKN